MWKDSNEKVNIKNAVFICVILMFALLCAITRNKNGTDTTGTISDIRKQQQSVNYEIGNIGNNIGNARQTVAGASRRVSEVQRNVTDVGERLAESKREIANLSKLARECQVIAEQNRTILKDVGEKNR